MLKISVREQTPDTFVTTPLVAPPTISSNGHTFTNPLSSSTPSSISASPHGSFSNLSSRGYPTGGSMRRQLLRRIWSKEYRRLDRTGSLSPPFRRAQRRFMNSEASPEICLECQKLENYSTGCMGVSGVADFMIKRQRFSNSSLNSTDKSFSDSRLEMTQESKPSETSINSGKVETSDITSTTNTTATENSIVTTSSERILTDNGISYVPQQESVSFDVNGNEMIESQRNLEKSEFIIEMEGDQLNVTTTTSTSTTSITVTDDRNQQWGGSTSPTPPYYARYESSTNSEANDACNTADDMKMSKTQLITDVQNANYLTNFSATNENIFTSTTTIDKFISQILLDNLNNVVIVEGRRGNNRNNSDNIRNESIIYELNETVSQSLSNNNGNTPVAIVSYTLRPTGVDSETINQNSVNDDQTVSVPSSCDAVRPDQTIYFPMDEGDDMSDYSAKYSNATDEVELPTNIIISVISGSVYTADDSEQNVPLLVRRLTDIARTESMEAQPSSASLIDEHEGNDNSDDDSISLVDSLDEPTTIEVDLTERSTEKSQAFFVPMAENQAEDHTGLDAAVAASMPTRLREKLQNRQIEMNRKKEHDLKRKQEELEKIINQNGYDTVCTGQKSEIKATNKNQLKHKTIASKENKNPTVLKKTQKFLRSEVGLLESYTIDAQGKLQFREPATKEIKRPQQHKKNYGVSAAVAKPNVKRPTETKIIKKTRETMTTTKSIAIKRSQIQHQSSTNRLHPPTEKTKARKDVQKMTLYHQSHSDIITPDTDCGPRRMYQKTEIQEGEKRIEILEIVECLNSSPDSTLSGSSANIMTPVLIPTAPKSSGKSSNSKIPVPCSKSNREKGSTQIHSRVLKARDGNIQNFTPSKNFIKNLQQISNNSRIDQIIADLLIEALNHSSDIGIEFVKTPQNVNTQPIIRLNGTKRVTLANRRTASGSTKRSAHSGKYQQVFDSIPEEKNNLSVDSSNDDVAFTSKSNEISNITASSLSNSHTPRALESPSISNDSKNSLSTPSNWLADGCGASSDASSVTNITRGKAAIQSDQDKPEVWFGYFGRSQHESPDETTLDEGILNVLHKSGVLA